MLYSPMPAYLNPSHPAYFNPYDATVAHYQQLLDDMRYDVGSHGVDGKMGGDTEAAIGSFQKDYGLPITKKFDAATTAKLDSLAKGAGKGLLPPAVASWMPGQPTPPGEPKGPSIGQQVGGAIPGAVDWLTGLIGKKEEAPAAYTPAATTAGPDYTVPIIIGGVSLLVVVGLGFWMMSGDGE